MQFCVEKKPGFLLVIIKNILIIWNKLRYALDYSVVHIVKNRV